VQHTRDLLSRLCGFFRAIQPASIQNITPKTWFAYLSGRMGKGLKAASNNLILNCVRSFLHFMQDTGQTIDSRMLRIRPQKTGEKSHRDAAIPDLKAILKATTDPLDRGWLLLMLHSGLRTCEIRRLKWGDVDFEHHMIRIEASKNLKSRAVPLTQPALDVLNALPRVSEFVFSRYHRPLSRSYCQSRLETIGKTCGVHITPHQLRHSIATLLLNVGMSVWGVKEVLGHRYVDTTLGYARTFDSTVEKEYQMAIDSTGANYAGRSLSMA
jgi:integrase/recombinase XerC